MEIAVIGAGSWGTTISKLLAEKHHTVRLWAYEEEVCEKIKDERENTLYLPGVKLPSNIYSTNSIEYAVENAELIVCVLPSHTVREVFNEGQGFIGKDKIILSATKGIEDGTLLRISEVLKETLKTEGMKIACLSGPSFAKEVAAGIPTAVCVASENEAVAIKVQEIFMTENFRVYINSDVIGVELGGALKNVIAIAAGACEGLGFGNNARAALITRGLAEIARLGIKLGAKVSTFAGLSGLGDLVLTCCGELSRNRMLGFKIGKGLKLKEAIGDISHMAVEGVRTAKAAKMLSEKEGVEMPITEQVYLMLYKDKPVKEAVKELLSRPPAKEIY